MTRTEDRVRDRLGKQILFTPAQEVIHSASGIISYLEEPRLLKALPRSERRKLRLRVKEWRNAQRSFGIAQIKAFDRAVHAELRRRGIKRIGK